MAYTPAITLVVAKRLYPWCNIEAQEVGNKVAFYTAVLHGETLQNTGLTALCKEIAKMLYELAGLAPE